jgi:hypothetical protein
MKNILLIGSLICSISLFGQTPAWHDKYDSVEPTAEGMAVVEQKERYGYADAKTGNLVIFCQYDDAESFANGLAAVAKTQGDYDKWGYIDRKGTQVVKFMYSEAYSFSEGLGLVGQYNADKDTWAYGYIDATGKVVIPLQYTEAESFENGSALVQKPGSTVEFKIDKTGKCVSNCP